MLSDITSRASNEAVTSPWLSRPETDPERTGDSSVRLVRLDLTSDGESSPPGLCTVKLMLPSDRRGVGVVPREKRDRRDSEPRRESGSARLGEWLTTGSPLGRVSLTRSRHLRGDCLDRTMHTSRDSSDSRATCGRSNRSARDARISSSPMNRERGFEPTDAEAEPTDVTDCVTDCVSALPSSRASTPSAAPHARHRPSFDLAPPITSHISYTPLLSE